MSRLIDFSDYRLKTPLARSIPNRLPAEFSLTDLKNTYKLTLDILAQQNPSKLLFTPKEAGHQLGVGEEFLRRRIKNGLIKTIYMGDKPMIQITELARLIIEGIQ